MNQVDNYQGCTILLLSAGIDMVDCICSCKYEDIDGYQWPIVQLSFMDFALATFTLVHLQSQS